MKPLLKLAAALSALLALVGCSNVQPWERGYLARPEMAFDPDPQEAKLLRHTYQSKEAASGGYGVGGGGCGCN
jgi:hypothetical protein